MKTSAKIADWTRSLYIIKIAQFVREYEAKSKEEKRRREGEEKWRRQEGREKRRQEREVTGEEEEEAKGRGNILNSTRICEACVELRISKYASKASASTAASDSFSGYGFDKITIFDAWFMLHFSKSLRSKGVPYYDVKR